MGCGITDNGEWWSLGLDSGMGNDFRDGGVVVVVVVAGQILASSFCFHVRRKITKTSKKDGSPTWGSSWSCVPICIAP